jgi:hypothetical protein
MENLGLCPMFWASQAFSLGLPERLFKACRPRFFGLRIFGQHQAQPYPAALAKPLLPSLTN